MAHLLQVNYNVMCHQNNTWMVILITEVTTQIYNINILLLLLVWHAPLGVRSAKRRHQSPEWTILSHSYRLIQ